MDVHLLLNNNNKKKAGQENILNRNVQKPFSTMYEKSYLVNAEKMIVNYKVIILGHRASKGNGF